LLKRASTYQRPELIPDPRLMSVVINIDGGGTWIWDQSLLTVRLNTRT